jgi:CPA1 family monovalent cation:H+ antiporter
VAYRVAVAAVLTGTFSAWQAGLQLVVVSVGGVLVGLAIGWLTCAIWARLDDPPVEITLSILASLTAYLVAEQIGLSGVVSVAAAGLYTGWRSPRLLSADTRVAAWAVWGVLVFLLNGLIFILVGLQLRSLDEVLETRPPDTVLVGAGLVCLATILVRIVFVFPATYVPRWLSRRIRERDPAPSWRSVLTLGWIGMRGGDSMAAALALPLTIAAGVPFPARDLIIALTFCVILVTIVLQGLTLPFVVRRLGLTATSDEEEREVEIAELAAARAALDRLEDLDAETTADPALIEAIRSRYEHLTEHDPDRAETTHARQHADERRLQRELVGAAREAIIALRDRGVIGDEALRETQRELDFEELRLGDEEDDALDESEDPAPARRPPE